MDKNALPQNLVGNWIWMSDGRRPGESRQFFRRDFVIDRLPATAELWVAASTTFQLYLNGRLTGLQSRPCPKPSCVHVTRLPVNFLLQQGVNQIAVQVFDAGKALANRPECQPGLWLQLDIDDEPFLWTNDEWMGLVPEAYISSGIDQAVEDVQTEMVDFNAYPHEWQTVPFTPFRSNQTGGTPAPVTEAGAAMRWKYPKTVIPIELMRSRLVPEGPHAELTEHLDWEAPLAAGHFHENSQALWVNFRDKTHGHLGGVFTAETFVYSKEDRWYSAECYCNRPYRLFLNEQVLSEQAVPPPPVHTPAAPRGEKPLAMSEYCPTDVAFHLEAGWNRLFLILDAAASGHGLTIIFTNCPAGTLGIHTRPNDRSARGWMVAGPLRTPFAQILPNRAMQEVVRTEFHLDQSPAWDTAILQRTFDYVPGHVADVETTPRGGAREPQKRERLFRLNEKEYVIFDFGRTFYGYLCVAAQGHEGDVVDVVCGEQLTDDRVLAFTGGRRSIATLTLSGDDDRWISDVPYGARYIMFQVRRSAGAVHIRNLHLRASVAKPRRSEGHFECSDPVLNRIWETGVATLSSTLQGIYMDAPCGEHAQYIADAMIQSWAGYHVFGAYRLSAQALESFAGTQLESGELNAACPSGLLQILPDYSLLWVIWLARHVSYTADMALLGRLLPCVERLLRCYEDLAEAPDGPLGDLSPYLGASPFLDQDDAIGRGGICTGLNGLYAAALHAAAGLERAANAPQKSHLYTQRALSVAAYMRDLAWDEEAGLFADCVIGETRGARCSWQTNVLALYGGLAVSDEQTDRIWEALFSDEAPFLRFEPRESENPYFKFFILETAFRLGKGAWALRMMEAYWGAMLEAGATTWWEMFSPAIEEDRRIYSRCHGYGTSPNAYLVSELAGIRPHPDGLGMARVVFAPHFPPGMKWLKTVVPTPLGTLAVEWHFTEDEKLDISISSSYGVEIDPVIDEAYADRVTLNVSSSVIIRPMGNPEAEEGTEADGDGGEA